MISMNEPATTKIEHISAWEGVELAWPEVRRVKGFFVWTTNKQTRPECPIVAKDWFFKVYNMTL